MASASIKRSVYAMEDLLVQYAWTVEMKEGTKFSVRETPRRARLCRSALLFQEVFRKLMGFDDVAYAATPPSRGQQSSIPTPQELALSTDSWRGSATMWLDRATFHHANKDFIVAVSRRRWGNRQRMIMFSLHCIPTPAGGLCSRGDASAVRVDRAEPATLARHSQRCQC